MAQTKQSSQSNGPDSPAQSKAGPRRRRKSRPPADRPFQPAACHPAAFDRMVRCVAPGRDGVRPLDGDAGLLDAAAAVALHAEPDAAAEVGELAKQVESLAAAVRRDWSRSIGRPADAADFRRRPPQAVLAHLHRTLFEEMGFRGNDGDYYNRRNSLLPGVIETRRGLPITLALLYKLVAGRLGLTCWGVGLPGHFLAGVDCGAGPILVDCFNGGRTLDRDDAAARVVACCGPEAGFEDDMLRPVTHRHWVTRMIQNLLQTHTTAGDFEQVAAMLELEVVLWPDQAHLRRDLGLVLARLGQTRPATAWLSGYLADAPEDPQRADLEELLGALS